MAKSEKFLDSVRKSSSEESWFKKVIGKIQKQINENNKYKYEFIVERFHVENLTL